MVVARTSVATGDELRIQNKFPDPVGKEISLTNEIAAVELLLQGAEWGKKLKEDKIKLVPKANNGEDPPSTAFYLIDSLSECEDNIIAHSVQQCTSYLSALRKRQKRQQKRAKKKTTKQEKEVLQSVNLDLD